MAEQSGGERTLPASQQKRNRAREEGNVARSQDLSAAVALLSALAAMRYMGAPMFERLVAATRFYFDNAAVLGPIFPFMLVMLVTGVTANILQVGFLFTTKPLVPKFSKLNPFAGLSNFFSLRSFVELVKSILKVTLVLYVTWITVHGRLGDYVNLMELTPLALLPAVGAMVVTLWWRIALVILALGILDYGFQRWQHDHNLMMTVQEAKEELKEYEGDPRIKQR
ncbi:MAG: EscU/YscU/HrcU family type III secretion system export apparatus switch protein, partial [Candidatus Hydrogenedentes bacterium]|nr:EscU/YscU/HrcU family type III secretion system export apparatus switch protein [Candidatus Hydrogenedentota bacterium]